LTVDPPVLRVNEHIDDHTCAIADATLASESDGVTPRLLGLASAGLRFAQAVEQLSGPARLDRCGISCDCGLELFAGLGDLAQPEKRQAEVETNDRGVGIRG
jgi:hypothetical protein